jgi:hypothetical protein
MRELAAVKIAEKKDKKKKQKEKKKQGDTKAETVGRCAEVACRCDQKP